MIGGSIRQLKVSLGNLIILVQDDSHVALIGRENNDVGDGVARAKADFSNLERGVVLFRSTSWLKLVFYILFQL